MFQDNLTPEPADMNDDDNFSSKYITLGITTNKSLLKSKPKKKHTSHLHHINLKITGILCEKSKFPRKLHKMLPIGDLFEQNYVLKLIKISKDSLAMWSGAGQALAKDAEKLKMMLLAWNYHSQAQGKTFVLFIYRGILL